MAEAFILPKERGDCYLGETKKAANQDRQSSTRKPRVIHEGAPDDAPESH